MTKTLFTLAVLTLSLALAPGCSKPKPSGPHFTVAKKGKKFVFQLYAGEDALMLESDPYKARGGAKAGVQALRDAAPAGKCFRHRVIFKAKNGQPLARSERYPDKQRCEAGLELAKKLIRDARPVK